MFRSKGNLLMGLFIILLGIILLLNSLGLVDISIGDLIFTYWPVIFIFLGARLLLNRGSTGEILSGVVFVVLGAILIGNNTNLFHINLDSLWSLLWPVILILVGVNLAFGKKGNGKSNFAILGSVEKKTERWVLKDSSFVAFWGGIELDLTLAEIPQEKTIVDLTAVMGGIEVIVPQDINIECKGTAILGGVELIDKSTGGIIANASYSQKSSGLSKKTVIFYSNAILGGIEIRHKKVPGRL